MRIRAVESHRIRLPRDAEAVAGRAGLPTAPIHEPTQRPQAAGHLELTTLRGLHANTRR